MRVLPRSLVEIENVCDNPAISTLNALIQSHNEAPSKQILEKIINACEEILTQPEKKIDLPLNDPTIEAVFTLQRKTVSLLFLPDAESYASARWKMIKHIVTGDNCEAPYVNTRRIMRPSFWGEAKYNGTAGLVDWVTKGTPRVSYSNYHLRRPCFVDTPYYNDSARYLLHFDREHKLFLKDGKPANVDGFSFLRDTAGTLIVVDLNGNIYLPGHAEKHSSVLKGQPVLFAGMCVLKDGRFTKITTWSGHYQCKKQHLLAFLDLLKKHYEIDLRGIVVEDTGWSQTFDANKMQLQRGMPCRIKPQVSLSFLNDYDYDDEDYSSKPKLCPRTSFPRSGNIWKSVEVIPISTARAPSPKST